MTISEQLKAIRKYAEAIKYDHCGDNHTENCGVCCWHTKLLNELNAIQATLSSAECDAGKIADNYFNVDPTQAMVFLSKKERDEFYETRQGLVDAITTALLAQREKYDALIATAEGDAKEIVREVLKASLYENVKSGNNPVEVITAALLKAGQREWLPIDDKAKDGNYYIITDGVSVKIGYMKRFVGQNGAEYTYWHDDTNDERLQITPTQYKHLNPPSSQEGVG